VVPPEAVNARLGIRAFSADGMEGAIARDMAKTVYDEISAVCGKGCVVWYDHPDRRVNVNYLLTGSVRKVDDEYWVNVRLLNIESGAVTFTEGRKTADSGTLAGEAKDVARKIAGKIR